MAHDYGKEKNRKKPAKKNQRVSQRMQVPGWILFGSGVAFTLFAQFLLHLATVDPETPAAVAENPATTDGKPAAKKPTINFYNQLKDMEVAVPGEETATAVIEPVTGEKHQASPTDASQPPTTAIAPAAETAKPLYSQVLQAGSYKNKADADEQRAALTLLGLKATITSKTNADGITYHRVMVGPFGSATELEKARNTLSTNNVPTITVKR